MKEISHLFWGPLKKYICRWYRWHLAWCFCGTVAHLIQSKTGVRFSWAIIKKKNRNGRTCLNFMLIHCHSELWTIIFKHIVQTKHKVKKWPQQQKKRVVNLSANIFRQTLFVSAGFSPLRRHQHPGENQRKSRRTETVHPVAAAKFRSWNKTSQGAGRRHGHLSILSLWGNRRDEGSSAQTAPDLVWAASMFSFSCLESENWRSQRALCCFFPPNFWLLF